MTVINRPNNILNAQDKECFIVLGNHSTYHGIGDLVYMLDAYFSKRLSTKVSQFIVPNQINVMIDEFSNPQLVNYMAEFKRTYPETKFVILATEFVTKIDILGLSFGTTFNFFHFLDSPRNLAKLIAYKLGIKKRPPYLLARCQGFINALSICDLVLCAHPNILDTMKLIPDALKNLIAPPVTLYPELEVDHIAKDQRLYNLKFGFVMTGSITEYRSQVVNGLLECYKQAGIHTPIYQRIPFEQSSIAKLDGHKMDYGYANLTKLVGASGKETDDVSNCNVNYLYNLNPPQFRDWAYSSPMRVQRAILLGQVPVLTKKFGDHEIENIARIYDGSIESAELLMVEATLGRNQLIEGHLEAIGKYNQIAREKNSAIDKALINLVGNKYLFAKAI